ncbi:MAG: iron-containing alcohol dehydrogenase [Gammaproteobacteria bacterium]|nr:iron-containing alcohol dehydrogenase [Gammaproteobacteria bacterium]
MLTLSPFSIGRLPQIRFGKGSLDELAPLAAGMGRKLLIVTGQRSFTDTALWPALQTRLSAQGLSWSHTRIGGEPSPQLIDDVVSEYHPQGIELVVGIGGGSVLDAAKAIAALLPYGNSVLDHLEDVGRGLPYPGGPLPLIAVPTTAGTGSEATKNAVLSVQGQGGYKKSFRHDSMVPHTAIIDPALLASCPRKTMAAQGMDAFTQLLESYVSLRANPLTDALAWSGLQAVAEGFMDALGMGQGDAQQGHAAMAYAALLSGICLAQTGLGSVHGLAQPLGSLFAVPHGVACGTTLAEATRVNLQALKVRLPDSPALAKYAAVGRLLSAQQGVDDETAQALLLAVLEDWTATLPLSRLGQYGIGSGDLPLIVSQSRNNSMKTNPVLLLDEEIADIVAARI